MSDMGGNDLDRRIAGWLQAHAPEPDAGLADRVLRRTVVGAQNRGGLSVAATLLRFAVVAVVIGIAVVVGLQVARVGEPEPPAVTPVPVASESPSATPTPTSSAPVASPSASPAATVGRIAFVANRDNESADLYLMDANGANVQLLVGDPAAHEQSPLWSPDGRLIAFITLDLEAPLGPTGAVFIVDVESGEVTEVDGAYPHGPAVWSPDGTRLALGASGAPESGIRIFTVATGALDQLTDDGGTAPHWSPDGSRVAYMTAGDVWIIDLTTGETRNLTASTWNDSIARWTDDGQRIVFVSDRETDQAATSLRSWTIDARGGEPELLGEPVDAYARWPSPDGQWLAYGAADGLHLSRTDGSEDRLVQAQLSADMGPSWAADSSAFVFSSALEDPRDIFVMRVDAEAPERLTDHPADESEPAWQPTR